MKVTEELARYILCLQRITDAEIESGKEDLEVRNQLEKAFPSLKQEREDSEFISWFWSVRIEKEPNVIKARFLLGHHIPFDEIYYYKEDPGFLEGSAFDLWKEHTEIAGELLQEAKRKAESRLIKIDKKGSINLHKEWKLDKALNVLSPEYKET